MKQFINFFFKRVGSHLIRLEEVFLQKNGKAGHIIEIKKDKQSSKVFIWKDNKDIAHVDGNLMGLSSDALLAFYNTHEYKTSM